MNLSKKSREELIELIEKTEEENKRLKIEHLSVVVDGYFYSPKMIQNMLTEIEQLKIHKIGG
jgi:hypothetical protein